MLHIPKGTWIMEKCNTTQCRNVHSICTQCAYTSAPHSRLHHSFNSCRDTCTCMQSIQIFVCREKARNKYSISHAIKIRIALLLSVLWDQCTKLYGKPALTGTVDNILSPWQPTPYLAGNVPCVILI